MIRRLLDVEGPVIGFLDKLGQLILVSVLWLLGCVPLVTIAAANSALYYAVVKSLRRGQGSPVKEFIRSFRENLLKSIPISLTAASLGGLLLWSLRQLRGLPAAAAVTALVLLLGTGIYLGPVLSRFRIKTAQVCAMALLLALRFPLDTLAVLLEAAAVAAVQLFLLPMPTVVLLPGACCWAASCRIEKALRQYMPPKEENDNAWYYET